MAIPNSEWIILKQWIKSNEENFYEGYYPLDSVKNDWNNYRNPPFTIFYSDKKNN